MRLFAIDKDETITAFPAAEHVPDGQEQFASEKELAKLAANWPADRLVNIWNSFAGVAGFGADLKPLKKFTDRRTAVKRIWAAIQKLDAPAPQETAPTAPQSGRRCAEEGQGNQGGQSQGGRGRTARVQQESHRAGNAAPQGRRDVGRDCQGDELAEP